MYQIGIIDDVAGQRADIQVAVLDNITEGTPVAFKEYELKSRSKEDLFKEIQEDISADRIHALIVDFRLDTTKDVIKGWEIIEFMHEEIPEFPVVILTNVPDEGLESPHTDADKVYAKKEFLKVDSPECAVMVGKILLNMKKYVSRRANLEAELTANLMRLEQNGSDMDAMEKVMEIENDLGRYKAIYQTVVDKSMDMDDLKEAFEQLKKYEDLLG